MEETKNLEQKKIENQELWRQLTKRNEQYMMQLDKTLKNAQLDEAQRVDLYHDMMTKLAAAQKSGKTARQLYGTVAECADTILKTPEKGETGRSKDWLIALDGGLLIGSILALVSGVSLLTNADTNTSGMGLITLILNFVLGGIALLIISKYMPDPNAPKGKRGVGKYLLATAGAMLAWMILMTLSMIVIPAGINVQLPAIGYLVIGAVGLGAKIYLKRKFHIRGGVF